MPRSAAGWTSITTVTLDSSRANNLFRYLNLLIRINDDDLHQYTLATAREFIRRTPVIRGCRK